MKLKPILKSINAVSFSSDDKALLPMEDEKGNKANGFLMEIIARAIFDYDPETEKVIAKNGIFDDLSIQNIMVVPK